MKAVDAKLWSESQCKAIEKERRTEVEEVETILKRFTPAELQRRGYALINLRISGSRMGLGRILVDFEPATGGMDRLVQNRFRVGDIVGVSEYPETATSGVSLSGVVSRVTETALTVAFSNDEPPDFDRVMLYVNHGDF
jgi:DNA polymerase alpha-associated DNA helicase A